MELAEFQKTMLDGVTALKSGAEQSRNQVTKLLSDVDRLSAESKTALEDLTKVKNHLNSVAEFEAKLKKVELSLRREARHAFGNPIERALANESFKNFLNALPRKLAHPQVRLPDHLERDFTGVDSSLGQATIPTEYASELYSLLYNYGQWQSLRVMNVGARTDVLPIQTARPSYYWIGAGTGGTAEGSAITQGAFTGTSVSLSIQTLAALVHVTRELLQDSTVDISGLVAMDIAQAVGYGLDFMAFAADATADQTDAGYYGIFQSATVNSNCAAAAAAGNITVEQTELEDWFRCLMTVTGSVLQRSAKWWLHPTILARAVMVRDANKRPLFQTALEVPSPGSIGSILGYPVVPVNAAPSTNAASAKVAVFGDPEGYVVGIRQGMEIASTDALKFAENMQSYRCTVRAGGKHRIGTGDPAGHVPFAVLTLPAA